MRAKKEQKKLNRRPHPSYPSAVNDLLGLLRASQSFHTTLCPVTYLREKQSCNSEWQQRGKNPQGKADFSSTAGTVQFTTQAPHEQQNGGRLLSPELFAYKFSSQAHNRSAILTGCSLSANSRKPFMPLDAKSCF